MQLPHDSGPIYKETLMGRLPVEPFNTYSNLLFLLFISYFALKVYRNPKQHLFLAWAIPVIFIGFVGGTLYHGTRSAEIWLYMDWVPIMVLCLAATIYFICKTTPSVLYRTLWIIATFGLNIGIRMLPIPKGLSISIGYTVTAIAVLLPLFAYCYKRNWYKLYLLCLAVGSFILAISCRIADKRFDILPMGSHWLWHSFGAIAVYFLMRYIYEDDSRNFYAK